GELSMLEAAEQQHILRDWNATAAEFPSEVCIQSLIEAQVAATPDAPALIFAGEELSYAEVNRRANQLAHKLREQGVGPDSLVGISVERSLEMVIGLVAIIKAGGAYVPLDLTQGSLLAQLPVPDAVQSLCLDQLDLNGYSEANPSLHTVPENLAYVIYTSGSTGKPKGAGNSHRALVNRLHWMQKAYGLDGSDTVLQKTPFSFDVSVWEFFWPLLTGARLAVALPGDHRDPERLVATINQYGVSTLHFVPSMLQAFMTSEQVESCNSLKRVVCSGEALPAELAAQVLKRLPQAGLYNLYGPTEAAIDVTHWTCTTEDHLSVPIGQPIDNLKTHILEDGLLPAAPGCAAELYLGGVGLARGYHKRPSLTAERFVPDPFSDNGGRLYRTGDLARYRGEGIIEYAGRIDHQVKIRGLRIELGEIEARLQEHPAVWEASVIDIDGPSGKQLAAYLVPQDASLDIDELKAHLKVHLPEFMVPSHFVLLEKMPLSANGKLDRRALPKPEVTQAAYVAPTSALESQLATIWAEVLKLEKVGVTDNFFELGGDSIISIQVVSRARQAGIVFTPKDLFQRQTVQGVAQVASRASAVQAEQGMVVGEAPLTPIQQWFFEREIAEPQQWNQAVLLTPREPLRADVLDAALQALLVQHDMLRASFRNGQAHLRDEAHAVLWVRELAAIEQLEALADEAQRSLDLHDGPLLRALLVNLPQGEQRLLLVIHHLVVDGVSWRILLEDLQAACNGAALPRKTSSFKHWAERLQQHAQSAAVDAQLGWWQAQLQGVSDELPCDRADGSLEQRHARSVSSRLDRELTRQLLQEAPAAYRTQINDLLLTALARVIGRWTGRAETLVRLEGHGREELFAELDITRTVGWFTAMYPVKLSAAAELDVAIKTVKEQLRAVPDKGLGYGLLRYLGNQAARDSLAGLAQGSIVFNYLGQLDAGFEDSLFAPASENRGQGVSPQASLGSLLSIDGQVAGGELALDWTFSAEVFDEATVQHLADDYAAELAALIAHCLKAPGAVTPSDFPLAGLSQVQLDQFPLAAREIADLYPLSPMQQGMLFHSLFEQEGGSYVNQLRAEVRGLQVERFRAAWQAVVDSHEVLRANFVSSFGQPLQVIRKHLSLPFEVQDWRGRADLEAALEAFAEADQQRGFDLQHDALLRLTLLRTGEDRWQLVYTSHHILLDGWSSSRLLGEVLQHYRGEAVAAPRGRYGDYIHWLQGRDAQVSERFWSEQLIDLSEPTRLVPVFKAPAEGEGFADQLLTLDAARTRRLNDFARDQRVTANTLLQAAWMLLLQRYTGQSGVTFGATVAGRPADLAGVEEQLGLFINTLPVVGSPRAEQRVAEFVQQVQARNLALREHEHTPLYDVQRWAGWSGEALFDSIMVFENYPIADALQQAAPQSLVFDKVVSQEQTHYPLTLVIEAGEQLSVRMSYDRGQLAGETVAQLAAHLGQLLDALVLSGQTALGELSMLEAAEQQHILRDWNATAAEFPSEACIQSLIEAQVAATPDAPALIFAGEELSYAEVNRRANQLAHKLREQGVGPDSLVGISVERSLEMVIGLVAIIKAGGAYVPLDPDYPQDRLAYMIEDSGIGLLLTQGSLLQQLPIPAGVEALCLDRLDLSEYSETNPSLHTVPENLAYVIYTSGSTGKPKGAGNSHRALVNRLHWMQKAYGLDGSDTVLQKTPFSFDVSVWEFFWPLLTGARLAVALPGDHRDPERLVATINQYGVSTLHFVPSMLQAFMTSEQVESCHSLKRVVCSGEALPAELAAQVLKRLPQAGLYNLYGPTEAAIDVTHWTCTVDDHLSVPIGQPIDNLKTHILEDGLLPAAPGCAAELYLGGVGLARGYHKRPSLTAERFVPDPFSSEGGRLYRTGDLARYRGEGIIEYAGRIDHQVKIRGLRIELGEIEARLQEHPAVWEASVIDIDGPSGKQLAAYLVPQDASLDVNELKAHLKVHLPEFMVPSHFVLLEKMPLSANGKLDRRALPKPEVAQAAYVAPASELERQLAAIWSEVLQVEQIGMSDDFFALGGHSLLATQIVSRLQKELGYHVPLRAMFELNTLQALAEYLVGQQDTRIDEAKADRLSDLMAELEAL
ncbi:amino acid adenylation domain-containing protein, partial [Pseudomonas sp. zfem002]|uniref:amino acid adenylation domain-containing protein n=1 Tax=Pseudomonas sp. zfem002 TaxID=3078197 RepID=UPI0039775951